MQPLQGVLEVTVFHFKKHLSLRTSIFLFQAFILLLCSCTGISKTHFFSPVKIIHRSIQFSLVYLS